MPEHYSDIAQHSPHMIRIPDCGVTEQLVIFADQAVLDQVQSTEDRVLDLGCGRGVFTEKMAAKGAQVTGVDLIPEEIEAARSWPSSQVAYHCIAAEELYRLGEQFDIIVSRFCFHHLQFPETAENIKACLEPGGRLFVVDCYQNFWTIGGRLYVLYSAFKLIGPVRFFRITMRLGYFFAPDRFAHVKSDIKRLTEQNRYTLENVRSFYKVFFPGCIIDTLGCAFTLSWQKPPIGL